MLDFLRTHKLQSASVVTVLVTGLAWLAFGYFGVHLLFVDDVVAEAAPTFDLPAEEATTTTVEAPSEPSRPVADAPVVVTPDTTTDLPTTTPTDTTAPAPVVAEIVVERSGVFTGDAHPTSGTASVLGNGTGQRFLRFEDFATDNGPDLNVYLVNSSTGDVSDYIDLGDLTGNIGDQNYEIPAGIDLDVYDQVAIWCVRFGVGFGNAQLSSGDAQPG